MLNQLEFSKSLAELIQFVGSRRLGICTTYCQTKPGVWCLYALTTDKIQQLEAHVMLELTRWHFIVVFAPRFACRTACQHYGKMSNAGAEFQRVYVSSDFKPWKMFSVWNIWCETNIRDRMKIKGRRKLVKGITSHAHCCQCSEIRANYRWMEDFLTS